MDGCDLNDDRCQSDLGRRFVWFTGLPKRRLTRSNRNSDAVGTRDLPFACHYTEKLIARGGVVSQNPTGSQVHAADVPRSRCVRYAGEGRFCAFVAIHRTCCR